MKNIYLLIAVLALSFTTSCEKGFLDTAPTSSISEESVFSTSENAMMAINGIHRMMHEGHSSGTTTSWNGQGGYPTFCMHLALMTDDVVWTYSNIMYEDCAKWIHHRDLSHKYNDLNYYWKFFYRIVNNANKVIEVYENEQLPSNDQYAYLVQGQAYAYRAFALFNLVQTWAERYVPGGNNNQLGVIIRTSPSTEPKARSTVEECYSLILSDLNTAYENLSKVTLAKENKSHIDQYVVKGLLARVYLAMGKWSEAADAASFVIEKSGAKLQDDTYTLVLDRNCWATNTEWLWAQIAKEDGSQSGNPKSWHNFISNNNASYNRNSPRAILNLLYNTIPDSDLRKAMWCEDPYTQTVYLPKSSPKKAPWMSQKWILSDNATAAAARDVAYMRLPEMYLIAAEGYARSKDASKVAIAQDYLYTLAHHRDPQYVKSASTGDELAEEVMWQRRVELWAECGLRWHDLKRLDLPVDRGPKPREGYNQGGTLNGWGTSAKKAPWNDSKYLPLDPEASNYNMYGEQVVGETARYIERPSKNKNWQWLIPILELNNNPECVQNE